MEADELSKLIRRVSGSACEDITLSSRLVEDLGMCSFDIMVLVTLVENKTGMGVDFEAFGRNCTVKGLLDSLFISPE